MIIKTKYNIGDRIKYRRRVIDDVNYPCEFCGGKGEALDYQGHLVECPSCEGAGSYWINESVEKEFVNPIREIRISDNNKIEYYFGSYNSVYEDDVISLVEK